MPLKLQLDSIDELDETLKPLYVEKNGKFVLDAEVEDTSALKGALQKERKAAETYSKQVKRWEALGKTPEDIEELLAAQVKTEEDKAAKAGEWDKLRVQMNEKHQNELKAKDETVMQMRRKLESELVDSRAIAAIASADGNSKILLPHVQRQLKVDENYNVLVVDDKGDPRVNGKGEPMTISDLVAEMKASDDYGVAFKGSGQSGSGMPPNNGGGNPRPTPKKADLMKDRKARTAFVRQYGVQAYEQLQ